MIEPRFERVPQTQDFRMPFDESDDGFERSWWRRSPGLVRSSRSEFYRIASGERDLARAELEPDASLHDEYVGLTLSAISLVQLLTIEVRGDARGTGIGSSFVEMLLSIYPESAYFLFPKESAEGYWERLGWRYHDRADQNDRGAPVFTFRTR